jgi:hypothetical protein
MTVAENDVLAPTDLALKAFSRALEPKELHILPGAHLMDTRGRILKLMQADRQNSYERLYVNRQSKAVIALG